MAKDIKVPAHIDSKLDHGFATTKVAADFLGGTTQCYYDIAWAQVSLATRPRSYMLSNGLIGDQT